jgi:hypothetical protein
MDLALNFGIPAEALKAQMSERELGEWFAYAARRFLPTQRLELALANVARMSAGSSTISEFIFDSRLREMLTPKVEQVETAATAAAAIGAMTGAGVYRLGERKVIPRG